MGFKPKGRKKIRLIRQYKDEYGLFNRFKGRLFVSTTAAEDDIEWAIHKIEKAALEDPQWIACDVLLLVKDGSAVLLYGKQGESLLDRLYHPERSEDVGRKSA